MFFGFGKAHSKRPTREHYEQEAALLLASRIAEGRPPPEVWRKAEEWRAKRAKPEGWYPSASTESGSARGAGREVPSGRKPCHRVAVGDPFVLRLVRLPVAGDAASATGSRGAPWTVRATAD